ncbi:MAG: type III pantothenate kinase [Bacteroidota bacterium]
MDLIIDLGNTNQKLAIFREGELLEVMQFPQIGLKLIREATRQNKAISHCILSSVVAYQDSMINYLAARFRFFLLDENTPLPIKNCYQTKITLGKDRLAAAVAGNHYYPGQNVLVVNAGTCITYDFVNAEGEYLGGGISPGIVMRFKALHTFTGKLPLIDFIEEDNLTGNDTARSILSGVLNGTLAEIEGVTARYSEIYPNLKIIISGGDVNYFDKRLKISTFAVPNIVIHGLQQILAFNVIKAS